MGRRQSGQDGVGLKRAMLDQAKPAVERAARAVVTLVPRSESGDNQAGICRLHRLMRSSVSRTCSAESGRRSSCGTATTPLPRFFNCIGADSRRDTGSIHGTTAFA